MTGVTLKQLSTRRAVLDVACSRCDRKGRYRVSSLIEKHGAEMQLPHLAMVLRGDCPNRATFTTAVCDVYYPELGNSPTDESAAAP